LFFFFFLLFLLLLVLLGMDVIAFIVIVCIVVATMVVLDVVIVVIVFDQLLTRGGTFIDGGAWNGCTSAYVAQRCGHVVAVEADPLSARAFRRNMHLNCRNVDLVEAAICARGCPDNALFGRNKFIPGTWNQSISQTRPDGVALFDDDIAVPTTTLDSILSLAPTKIDLVKVDIEGGEEALLQELLALRGHQILLSFHLTWWKDQDLTRFDLTEAEQIMIRGSPFGAFLIVDGRCTLGPL
jgi:FkbM family methyltransferase